MPVKRFAGGNVVHVIAKGFADDHKRKNIENSERDFRVVKLL